MTIQEGRRDESLRDGTMHATRKQQRKQLPCHSRKFCIGLRDIIDIEEFGPGDATPCGPHNLYTRKQRLCAPLENDKEKSAELRNVSCTDERYLTRLVLFRLRRFRKVRSSQMQPVTGILVVENSLNAFYHGQGLLRSLLLGLFQ